MSRHLNGSRIAAICAAVAISTTMPFAPAAAEPNCAVEAYLFCKDGQWAAHGYASEAECRAIEADLCDGSAGNRLDAGYWERIGVEWLRADTEPTGL